MLCGVTSPKSIRPSSAGILQQLLSLDSKKDQLLCNFSLQFGLVKNRNGEVAGWYGSSLDTKQGHRYVCSASIKVLNWGLGPHEDQTAEMVLILHKGPHFPQLWDILGLEIVFLYHKWRNIEISTSILLYSTCSDLGSSKALKRSSFSPNFFLNCFVTILMLFVLKSSKKI